VGLAAEGFLELSDVTIRRNIIAGNGTNGIQIQDSDALVANNTIWNNGDFGIFHETSSDTPSFWPTLVNNIVTEHTYTGIYTDYDQCNLTYSLAWNNTVDLDVCTGGDGILAEDPLLADPAGGDFALGVGSPAIDAGDPDAAWDDEDGSRNDLGALGGPAQAGWPDDEPPVLEFPPEADLQEGSARTIHLPDEVDPEDYPVLVVWEISGGSNGEWTAYGTTIALNGEDDGDYTWTTTITDPFGQTAQAQGSLTVTNVAPGLTSTMPEEATAGVPYLYQAEYFDPGFFDEHAFTLPTAPEGMTVDVFGVVEWTPTSDQVGDHQVELVVTDDDGDSTSQIRIITVRAGQDTPEEDCSCRLDRGRSPGGAALAALLLLAGLAARRRRWHR
jgi:MYXO-CTERM domain-containing protein